MKLKRFKKKKLIIFIIFQIKNPTKPNLETRRKSERKKFINLFTVKRRLRVLHNRT